MSKKMLLVLTCIVKNKTVFLINSIVFLTFMLILLSWGWEMEVVDREYKVESFFRK